MNPVRGIETLPKELIAPSKAAFKLMNPVRGIETGEIAANELYVGAFKLMNPVRGIETHRLRHGTRHQDPSFKLMNPVRGIETRGTTRHNPQLPAFQINESRSRD